MRNYFIALLVLITFNRSSNAEPASFAPFYQSEYSDNIDKQPEATNEGWINAFGIRATKEHKDGNFEGTLAGVFGYRYYDAETKTEDEIIGFTGIGTWKVIPDRFELFVADYLSEVPIERFVTTGIDNEQTANVLIVAPMLQARLDARHDILFDMSTAWVYDDETDSDRLRFAVAPQWRFRYSPITNLYFIYQFSRLDYFDESFEGDNYDRKDVLFRLENIHRRYRWSLDLGASEIIFADESDDVGALGRFSWEFNTARTGTLALYISSEYSDLIADFQRNSQVLSSLQEQVTEVSLFKRDRIELSYSKELFRTNINISSYVENIDRFEVEEQELTQSAGLNIYKNIGENVLFKGLMTLGFFSNYSRIEFQGRSDALTNNLNLLQNNLDYNEEFDIGLQLGFIINKNLAIRLELTHIDVHSTNDDQIYEENIVGISFAYNSAERKPQDGY